GEDVLCHAAQLLSSYDELARIGRAGAQEPSGVIRLAAPAAFARHHLGPSLARFRKLYPQVRVELQLYEGALGSTMDEADLALCLQGDLRSMQIARQVTDLMMGIYASPRYLAQRGQPTHPSDLTLHDCLTVKHAGSAAKWSFGNSSADTES